MAGVPFVTTDLFTWTAAATAAEWRLRLAQHSGGRTAYIPAPLAHKSSTPLSLRRVAMLIGWLAAVHNPAEAGRLEWEEGRQGS